MKNNRLVGAIVKVINDKLGYGSKATYSLL